MKKNLYLLIASILLPAVAFAVANLRTDSGFYYPTNKKHSASNYLGFKDKNSFFGNRCHLANDYDFPVGTPVYSVGPGTVQSVSTNTPFYGGSDGTPGGVMVIKHTLADDTFFFGLYGHVQNISVNAGDSVTGGQQIAEVGPFTSGSNSQPHLHFGVNPTSTSVQGYSPTTACTDLLGFVDPEPYLLANSPKLPPAETCTAKDDSVSTSKNTIVTTASVLSNDTDTNGDTLVVASVDANSAQGEAVSNNNDGTFTYTPPVDFTGTDSFNYTVTDNNGCTDQGKVTVNISSGSGSSSSGGGSQGLVSLAGLLALSLLQFYRRKKQYKKKQKVFQCTVVESKSNPLITESKSRNDRSDSLVCIHSIAKNYSYCILFAQE